MTDVIAMIQQHDSRKSLDEDERISTEDDRLSSKQFLLPQREALRPSRPVALGFFIASVLLTIFSIVLFTAALTTKCKTCEIDDKACAARLSTYLPALDGVEYEWVQWPNKFSQKSQYRGKPTSELEEAWEKLEKPRYINIPRQRLADLGKNSTYNDHTWFEVYEDEAHGINAGLEMWHQIHCLNLIRKFTYQDTWDYSSNEEWTQGPKMLRHHVDHCIDALRVTLMCSADTTTILLYNDPESPNGASFDFETWHRCRKWDKLVDWAVAHRVP